MANPPAACAPQSEYSSTWQCCVVEAGRRASEAIYLFDELPERTRLQRLLKTHQDWCDLLMAEPTFFTVIDTYPIELIFPIREGRSKQQVDKKGKDKGRWSIGIKLCWLLNETCRVVARDRGTMNVHDQHFHPVVKPFTGQTIVLADYGFRDQEGIPENIKLCQKGTWNERMCVETALSMVTLVCDLKRIRHRVMDYIQAGMAYVSAVFNILPALFHSLHPDADPYKMSIADWLDIKCMDMRHATP